MLSRSSQTSRSILSTAESISPLQDYLNDLQSKSAKKFPEIEEEEPGDDKRNGKELSVNDEQPGDEDSDFAHLIAHNDFEEMFNQFFVIEHKKLMMIQANIQQERNLDKNPLLHLTSLNAHDTQALREYYYQLQMVLFKSPRGREYDMAL